MLGTQQKHAGFDLATAGTKVRGAAYIQGWGYAPISDGVWDGDTFEFALDRTSVTSQSKAKVKFRGQMKGESVLMTIGDAPPTTLHRVESRVTGPVSIDALPSALEGKWTTRFVGRIGDRPKMIGHIDLDLRVHGSTLTGVVHTGTWPGDCVISQGKIDRGRFSFTATGRSASSSGIPILWFKGEIHGHQLKLTMRHQIFGPESSVDIPLDAART